MDSNSEPLVVGVRFTKVGKVYHFAADAVTDIKKGDMVVVETTRGWQLGQVAQILQNADPPPEGWKEIDRRATPRDLLLRQMWQMKEAEVIEKCRARAAEIRLVGIKIISAEYSFDGSRLMIMFSSETEEKFELKSLRSDMQKMFAPSQVEMRQIGPRDVAKSLCGMGACGLETRCCCLFLTEFSSISIRMAKEQGISLTPSEITGMCGRLRCCLIYEYDNYVEARAKLPKRNKRVITPEGEGKVVDVIPLRESVTVDLGGEVGRKEFLGTDVQVVDGEGRAPQQPFKGTQQASQIDQAITGDSSVKPFEVAPGTPEKPSDWENPPATAEPRSMPRTDRPQRDDRRRRGGRNIPSGKDMPGGRDAAGGDQPSGGQQGGGPQSDRGPQGDRGPQQGRTGSGKRSGGRSRRPGKGGGPRQTGPSGQPGGEKPSGPGDAGGKQSSGDRSQPHRRGKRRDSNDSENRS